MNADDFASELCDELIKLRPHEFLSKEQASFFKNLKLNLQSGEFLITFDFAENYKFVLQNSSQGFHWNNDQATIFTIVIYYRKDMELEHKSMVIISDNLNHDTIAVYEYQNIILKYIVENISTPKKVYYFTDGAGQHFKNKSNFANLLFHEEDFKIPAEWHFHPTAHGKGACDGVGANIKRDATKFSLQCSNENRILDARALFQWAKSHSKKTEIFFSSKVEYEETAKKLKNRFNNAVTIKGTLQYHGIIPTGDGRLKLKKFSAATEFDYFPKDKKRTSDNTKPTRQNKKQKKR